MISVSELVKTYRVPVKSAGLSGSLRSLWHRQTREVRAVDGISFSVAPGEAVGFLGPNGAGKTTTLKMLTGLLHPTSGQIDILGYSPQKRPHDLLRQITLVMGQKQQLLWDLPPRETFILNRALYDIDLKTWRDTLDELVELLDLHDVIDRPTRNLSLGQRMRAELVAALIHRPKLLFLDEPTIGLDIEVQATVRSFICEYRARHQATVILTSHDMNDVAMIAERVILIGQGQIGFDGPLKDLTARFARGRRMRVSGVDASLAAWGFQGADTGVWEAAIPTNAVNEILCSILSSFPHAEITVSDPALEDIMRRAFGATRDAAAEVS